MGSVLYPQDDRLKDGNVYNPKLVIDSIYKVLNESEFSNRYQGILRLDQLNPILGDLKYSIADAMCKFEMAFEVEAEQKLIVTDLLTEEEPKIGEWKDFLAFEYHYNLLPSSIISRFIVRNQKYIENNKYWRYGALLCKNGDRALVKADLQNKRISIWVSSVTEKGRDKFLKKIREQFYLIHKTIPSLKIKEKFPQEEEGISQALPEIAESEKELKQRKNKEKVENEPDQNNNSAKDKKAKSNLVLFSIIGLIGVVGSLILFGYIKSTSNQKEPNYSNQQQSVSQ